jgi:hypothetical protein
MKKILIILGIIFLLLVALFTGFVGLAFFQANKMMPTVQNFTDGFYKQLDSQNYGYIYNQLADDKFKSSINYENFEKMMKNIYQKLGKTKEIKRGAWKLNYMSDGTYFNIQYTITREKGTAVESFTLKQYGESWRLIFYNINSQALLYS